MESIIALRPPTRSWVTAVQALALAAIACLAEERGMVLVDWLSLVISPPTTEALRHYFATAL